MNSKLIIPLLCALVGSGVSAQTSDWSMGARFSFGATLAGKEPQWAEATVGAGIWVERKLTDISAVFGEVNYQYFKADGKDVTKYGWGYYPTAVTPFYGLGMINAIRSVDFRTNQISGYGILCGYRHYITPSFSTHYGIGLTSWLSQQEVTGELRIYDTIGGGTGTGLLATEGLGYIVSKRSLKPVLNTGVKYNFTQYAAVMGDIRYINYRQAEYVPFAYTGYDAHVKDLPRNKVSFDLSFSIQF